MKQKISFYNNGINGNNSDINPPIQIGTYDYNGENSENSNSENDLNVEDLMTRQYRNRMGKSQIKIFLHC